MKLHAIFVFSKREQSHSPRYSRRAPLSSEDDEGILDQHGRQGLLRRVLNSGLLLREGYATPEAGARPALQPPFSLHFKQARCPWPTISSLLLRGCTISTLTQLPFIRIDLMWQQVRPR